jgi:hypothetical protein
MVSNTQHVQFFLSPSPIYKSVPRWLGGHILLLVLALYFLPSIGSKIVIEGWLSVFLWSWPIFLFLAVNFVSLAEETFPLLPPLFAESYRNYSRKILNQTKAKAISQYVPIARSYGCKWFFTSSNSWLWNPRILHLWRTSYWGPRSLNVLGLETNQTTFKLVGSRGGDRKALPNLLGNFATFKRELWSWSATGMDRCNVAEFVKQTRREGRREKGYVPRCGDTVADVEWALTELVREVESRLKDSLSSSFTSFSSDIARRLAFGTKRFVS